MEAAVAIAHTSRSGRRPTCAGGSGPPAGGAPLAVAAGMGGGGPCIDPEPGPPTVISELNLPDMEMVDFVTKLQDQEPEPLLLWDTSDLQNDLYHQF